MIKKEYVDIVSIDETNDIVEMVDIEVDTPDNTFLLEHGISTHNSNVGIINQLTVDAAITSARGSFVDKTKIDNDYGGILGINSCLVPYVSSTDGNRVMFAGSQGRQAIPINGVEPPLVQTGYESILPGLLSDAYVKKAIEDGTVISVNDDSIKLKLKSGKTQTVSLSPVVLNSAQGQSSLNYFKPSVKIGSKVKKNQILAEGKHLVDGVLSVGTNLLCAVMFWKGYSYEDGYIISDRVAVDKLSSSAYHEFEVLVRPDDEVHFIAQEKSLTKTGDPLLVRTSKEIEEMVGLDADEIQQGRIISKSPGGRIISIEVYPNTQIKKFPGLVPAYENFRKRYEAGHGSFPAFFTSKFSGSEKIRYSGVLVKFKIEEEQRCVLGDKICNSFGGKGVLSRIEPEENMPVTPWGEKVEVILNPIAIINRMNPSTIKELYTSLLAKSLARKLVEFGTKKSAVALNMISKVVSSIDMTDKKQYTNSILAAFKSMSDSQYKQYIENLKEKNYHFPIIVPPFKEPTMVQLKDALSLLQVKTEYNLYLPEWKTSTKNPVAVGWLYYKKLEQQSGIKMSARATGMVNPVTKQATASKKMGGGQRIGEMDSWSIINHGAINVLKEFFGPLSDDPVTKQAIISDIIQKGEANYREPKTSATRDLLKVYMQGLMLEAEF